MTTGMTGRRAEAERAEQVRERLRRLQAAADRQRREAELLQKEAFLSRFSNEP